MLTEMHIFQFFPDFGFETRVVPRFLRSWQEKWSRANPRKIQNREMRRLTRDHFSHHERIFSYPKLGSKGNLEK